MLNVIYTDVGTAQVLIRCSIAHRKYILVSIKKTVVDNYFTVYEEIHWGIVQKKTSSWMRLVFKYFLCFYLKSLNRVGMPKKIITTFYQHYEPRVPQLYISHAI